MRRNRVDVARIVHVEGRTERNCTDNFAVQKSWREMAMKNQLTNRGNLEPHRRSRQNLSALPNRLRG
jgi:hypothetical protein